MKVLKFKKFNEGIFSVATAVASGLLIRFLLTILKRYSAYKSLINDIKILLMHDISIQEYSDLYYIVAKKKVKNGLFELKLRILKNKRKINIQTSSTSGEKDVNIIISKNEHQSLIKIIENKL